jgi:hypothetical protein
MCFCATHLLVLMDNTGVATQASTLNRTSLRNIVLKSSFARVQGPRLNFAHLNPGSAVPHIGEMNEIFNGVDLQLIAVSETWFKTRHTNRQVNINGFRVIRADRGGKAWWWRCLVLPGGYEVQGSCAVYANFCSGLPLR